MTHHRNMLMSSFFFFVFQHNSHLPSLSKGTLKEKGWRPRTSIRVDFIKTLTFRNRKCSMQKTFMQPSRRLRHCSPSSLVVYRKSSLSATFGSLSAHRMFLAKIFHSTNYPFFHHAYPNRASSPASRQRWLVHRHTETIFTDEIAEIAYKNNFTSSLHDPMSSMNANLLISDAQRNIYFLLGGGFEFRNKTLSWMWSEKYFFILL